MKKSFIHHKTPAVILLIWLLLINSLPAATYHVTTNGNDTTGDGSLANPWRTITKGKNTMAAGDILLVHGNQNGTGIYSTETYPIGPPPSSSNTNYASRTQIIGTNGPVWVRPPTNVSQTFTWEGVAVSNINVFNIGVTMEDTGAGGSGAGWRISGVVRVLWSNCPTMKIPHGHGMLFSASDPQKARFVEVVNSEIFDAGYQHDIWDPGGTDDHGIYWLVDDGRVQGCTIHNNQSHGIHGFGSASIGCAILGNQIYSNSSVGIGFYSGSHSNLIANNQVWRNSINGKFQFASTNTIANNTFWGGGQALQVLEQAGAGGSVGNLIINNLITAMTLTIPTGEPIQIGTGATNTTVATNICYANAHANEIFTTGSVNTTQSGNFFGDAYDAELTSPPTNFEIGTAGDAVGVGQDLSGLFTVDFFGTTRTVPWDLGSVKVDSTPVTPAAMNNILSGTINLSGRVTIQ